MECSSRRRFFCESHNIPSYSLCVRCSQQRREKESLKIRDDLEMKWSQLESLADRLERAAGLQFKPRPDGK